MPDLTPEFTAEARRLLDECTNGPWRVTDLRDADDGNRECLWVDAVPDDGPFPRIYRTVAEMTEDEGLQVLWSLADAQLIALMRNNFGALLDELDRLRALAQDRKDDLLIATTERDEAHAQLAAIKTADPDLFDPSGGNSRGAAYETYGSAGHNLREMYLAAIGLTPKDGMEVKPA